MCPTLIYLINRICTINYAKHTFSLIKGHPYILVKGLHN